MKLAVAAIFLLASCASADRYIESAPSPKPKIQSQADPAYTAMMKCDNLGMRQGETHRLCVMREIDRLKAVQTYELPRHAPIQVLPYPYPPLAPGNSIHVIPFK